MGSVNAKIIRGMGSSMISKLDFTPDNYADQDITIIKFKPDNTYEISNRRVNPETGEISDVPNSIIVHANPNQRYNDNIEKALILSIRNNDLFKEKAVEAIDKNKKILSTAISKIKVLDSSSNKEEREALLLDAHMAATKSTFFDEMLYGDAENIRDISDTVNKKSKSLFIGDHEMRKFFDATLGDDLDIDYYTRFDFNDLLSDNSIFADPVQLADSAFFELIENDAFSKEMSSKYMSNMNEFVTPSSKGVIPMMKAFC